MGKCLLSFKKIQQYGDFPKKEISAVENLQYGEVLVKF